MEVLQALARNLGRLRSERGLTISGLSQRCGIAKSTLSNLELAHGNPTVETLWAIANALDVPFGHLLGSTAPGAIGMADAASSVLFIERTSSDDGASMETYRMTVKAGHTKQSAAHPPGVMEKVVVTSGPMLLGDSSHPKLVNTGEIHAFAADVPHVYGAIGKPAQAMVFVEYPAPARPRSDAIRALGWPATAADWEDVHHVLERMRTEVANGVACMVLRLEGSPLPAGQTLQTLRSRWEAADSRPYRWPVLTLTEMDGGAACIVLLPQRFTQAFRGPAGPLEQSTTGRLALELARRAETLLTPQQPGTTQQASTGSWVLDTLACECALHEGQARLPDQLQHLTQRSLRAIAASTQAETFSSRIDVDHYDAFELLHPAYARQVVAMAQDVQEFVHAPAGSPLCTIDVGTGPGIPLLMLQELLPGLEALAIEPDPVAFACLTMNTHGCSAIALHQGDFLALNHRPGQAPLITCTGATRHFNTAFMLQKAWSLLKPGGTMSVADEFLPAFRDLESRNLALVRHHAAYILSAAGALEHCDPQVRADADGRVYSALRQGLIQAILQAEQGQQREAVRLCRNLHLSMRQASLEKRPDHIFGAYARFFWVELQAMVAGFDYEVERKTHVRRFLDLASATGFELLRQRRIFATSGPDERDGGTHVITLRRPL